MLLVRTLIEQLQGHHLHVGLLEPHLLDVARFRGHQLELIELVIGAEQDLALCEEVLQDPVPQQGPKLPHALVAASVVKVDLLRRLEAVAVEDHPILPPRMQQWVHACVGAVQRGQDRDVPRDAHGSRGALLIGQGPPRWLSAHVDQRPSLIRVAVIVL